MTGSAAKSATRPTPDSSPAWREGAVSDAQAYLLGWIASAGTIGDGGIVVRLRRKDARFADELCQALAPELAPRPRKGGRRLHIRSAAFARDARSLLGCELGTAPANAALATRFPPLPTADLGWAFARGCVDATGRIRSPRCGTDEPRCRVAIGSQAIRQGLRDFCGIRCSELGDRLDYRGNNALDLLARLYEGAPLALPRNLRRYEAWCCWVPSLSGSASRRGRRPLFRWRMTDPRAQAPYKERASDSGYDLTLIRKERQHGQVTLYGTGIQIEPDYGWYFDLVARSSIIRTGHILANSVGVIDRAYRGEVLVPVFKVDPDAPPLELPCRLVQIVPRPVVHFAVEQVDELDQSERGAGGFGSTGR